jgi:glycosyltransferase involved in cell wall biosynthesis
MSKTKISVIIPAYNEEESVKPLYTQLEKVLSRLEEGFEIIFVSDGSRDKTKQEVAKIRQKDQRVKLLVHQKSLGKAAALGTGLDFAQGELVVFIDADLQDEPEEIPKLIKKLKTGYDLVNGWRRKRGDTGYKVLTSKLMNFFILITSGLRLHDFYCPSKCFKRKALKKMKIYGDLFRFTPVLAQEAGLKIIEMPVKHHQRKFGQPKYSGWKRYKRAVSDMAIILFAVKRQDLPPWLFAGLGLVLFWAGLGLGSWLSLMPRLVLIVLGIFLLGMAILAEWYYRRQLKKEKIRKDSLKEKLL